MKPDQDITEFFARAMYEWFWGTETMADYYMDMATTSLRVNEMYQREILGKMN